MKKVLLIISLLCFSFASFAQSNIATKTLIVHDSVSLGNVWRSTWPSSNAILNQTTQQSSSNFNISGTGTFGTSASFPSGINIISGTNNANNIFLGSSNGGLGFAGTSNIAIGNIAAIGTGSKNVLLGFGGFQSLTTGGDNIALGENTLNLITTQDYSIALGSFAGNSWSGDTGLFVGYAANQFKQTPILNDADNIAVFGNLQNVEVSNTSLFGSLNTNVIIGDDSLIYNAGHVIAGFVLRKTNDLFQVKGNTWIKDTLKLPHYIASSGNVNMLGVDDVGNVNTYDRTGFILNQTIQQPSTNFNIDGHGSVHDLSITGDSLIIYPRTYTWGATAIDENRFMSAITVDNSTVTNMPANGVNVYGGISSLTFANTYDINSHPRNSIAGFRAALGLNSSGSNTHIYTEGKPLAGLTATTTLWNNGNYQNVAAISAEAPYTYNTGGYSNFSGHVDTLSQIYLDAPQVNGGVDTSISHLFGINQQSKYPNIFQGGLQLPIRVSSLVTDSITYSDYTIIYTGNTSDGVWKIPAPTTNKGQVYHIVAQTKGITLDNGYVPITGGSAITTIASGISVTIQSDGTDYYQIQ